MSNNLLDTGSIPSGGTMDIIAPNANYIVKYANNTVIQTGVILAGGTATIIVTDPVVCEGWDPPIDWKWDDASALLFRFREWGSVIASCL